MFVLGKPGLPDRRGGRTGSEGLVLGAGMSAPAYDDEELHCWNSRWTTIGAGGSLDSRMQFARLFVGHEERFCMPSWDTSPVRRHHAVRRDARMAVGPPCIGRQVQGFGEVWG